MALFVWRVMSDSLISLLARVIMLFEENRRLKEKIHKLERKLRGQETREQGVPDRQ